MPYLFDLVVFYIVSVELSVQGIQTDSTYCVTVQTLINRAPNGCLRSIPLLLLLGLASAAAAMYVCYEGARGGPQQGHVPLPTTNDGN